jgi:histidinol dehydrogenase
MIVKALRDLTPQEHARLLGRAGGSGDEGPREAARAIVERVRREGDEALRALTKQFDGVDLQALEVPKPALAKAWRGLTAAQRGALQEAARNIAAFHRAQRPKPLRVEVRPGVVVGREPRPLTRVGLYAPGGRAAYPSSVLMAAIPAQVAGVGERVLCSPPGPDGAPASSVLAAAHLAKVERVFALGGAQAIAAMALGTPTVPKVAKIVGPGNAYVQAAKALLAQDCGMDTPAGPSEAVIVADAQADPDLVARELLCQSEHGPDSASIAIVPTRRMADLVAQRVEAFLEQEPRAATIRASLEQRGAILVGSVAQGVAFSEAYAPEHLLLLTRDAKRWLPRIAKAGSVFLGAPSAIALGDYCSGSNHVLPTAGAAAWSSGLQVEDFVRYLTWQEVSPKGAATIGPAAITMARLEGLEAHARSVEARLAPPPPRRRRKAR